MSDYDMSIHSNPDARAWARFFAETMAKLGQSCPDEDTMHGWFANAMMAMSDHLASRALAASPSRPAAGPLDDGRGTALPPVTVPVCSSPEPVVTGTVRVTLDASPSRPSSSWRAIYERLFEKGPDSFSKGERETIRAAIKEAWNAGAAASPSREAPGDLTETLSAVEDIEAHDARGCPPRQKVRDLRADRDRLIEEVARLSRNEGTALAPWYEADGSTVMLPVAEVERRRRLAAKVIAAAAGVSDAADAWEVCGEDGENRVTTYDVPAAAMRDLRAALDALPAASPPPPTPEAKP
jgi:hypothetical protein